MSTEAAIAELHRRQLGRIGFGHDLRRSVATIDPTYYRWTQWIFLQIFNSWYDPQRETARPISGLIADFESGARPTPDGRAWAALSGVERDELLGEYRLAYAKEVSVNWCPGLGTVLANEEVTADGRSERGNFPVFKSKLRQWMMRITAYTKRPADHRPGAAGLALRRSSCSSATGSAAPRARAWTSPSWRGRDHRLHHAPGHAVRRDVHGAGSGARPGDEDRAGRVAGGDPRGVESAARRG